MSALFCFGLGYTAGFLARALQGEGWRVGGTSRDAASVKRLAAEGFVMHPLAPGRPLADAASALGGVTHILVSVPPDASGDPVLAAHAADLAALRGLQWLGYLSTTGVYGDRGGAWVDETDRLEPTGERGRRRVAAEAQWLALQREHGIPVHIFRLAGIYGPGRSALDTVRQGRAQRIDKPGQVFSRIHVADIVQVLRASMARPRLRAIYNVCDDDPAAPEAVIAYACELLGVTPPPLISFDAAKLSPMALSFYDDNKRVSNRRMKEELGVSLRYPSYRDGLKALLNGPSGETPSPLVGEGGAQRGALRG
jgi:nucleoside-diphosphate-sugar epimerase